MDVTWNKWERVASDRNWLAKTIWAFLKLEADKVRAADSHTVHTPSTYTALHIVFEIPSKHAYLGFFLPSRYFPTTHCWLLSMKR